MENYDVIKTIGKGASGTVLLATEKKSSRYSWVNLQLCQNRLEQRTKSLTYSRGVFLRRSNVKASRSKRMQPSCGESGAKNVLDEKALQWDLKIS